MVSKKIPAPSYREVYVKGRSASNRYLVLYYLTSDDAVRMGVSVSRRVGKAVVRNKLRRRIKEVFRRLSPLLRSGQFVFIARRGSGNCTYQELESSIEGLFKRMNCYRC